MIKITTAKITCVAIGNLQAMAPPANDKPYVSQYAYTKPTPTNKASLQTKLPRISGLACSACIIGITEVTSPVDKPAMNLPIIK